MTTQPIYSSLSRESPNWEKAMATAIKVLKCQPQRFFPLKLAPIIDACPDLHLLTFDHFAEANGCSLDRVIELIGSEDGALWYSCESKTYLLIFNDKITTESRIRWTLAHELGHYFLGHNLEADAPVLGRSSISEARYHVFEQEANYFAKRLLAPYQIVVALLNDWRQIRSVDLRTLFGISDEAAKNYISELNKRKEGRGIYADGLLIPEFSDYLSTITHLYMCMNCYAMFDGQNHIVCPICGNQECISVPEEDIPEAVVLSPLADPFERLVLS